MIKFLKKNENTRKVFGKRELKIIEKQLMGIKLTQSEKNRLSRDIRKKFDFIKEICRYNFDFDMRKGSVIKKRVEYAKELILGDKLRKKIKKIYLFGSSVKNERTFRSDIDIAVEFDDLRGISNLEIGRFRLRIMREFDKTMDVQVFNVLPDKIKNSIMKNHKVIYKNG